MAKLIGVSLVFMMVGLLAPCIASAQETRLIVRGDDMGMTQGSLVAFEKAFNEGVLTCASIIVPAPWFQGAIELVKRNPKWCVGIHLALVGEWRGYRWRPVSPWDKVSSLVDEDGFLHPYPDALWAKTPKLEEIESELRAQVKLTMKSGIRIHYLDFHYSMGYPGLSEVVRKISAEFGLPVSGAYGEKRVPGIYKVPCEEKTEVAVKMLQGLGPGLWLWVTHPGIDSPEQNALVHTKAEDVFRQGGIGKHRAAELEALISSKVRQTIKDRGIRLISYKELRD